jgi:hypothetical protein
MGQGRFKNGKFDLLVVANFVMSASDWTEWERSFKKASEILYNASEGQMEFGQIFVCDDSVGLETAEIILHSSGDPSYGTLGLFGSPGAALHLMPYVKRQVLTTLHEMGHHVWSLGEEYAAPAFFDEIDKTNPAPNRTTIPIIDSGRADDELVALNAKAILVFGDLIERHTVTSNTATTVTVDTDFSDLPTNSDSTHVQYQTPAECATAANSNFCIMEKSRGAAGAFDAVGNWIDVANPVTEFCTPSNHDSDHDTQQDDIHNRSCWEIILEREEFSSLTNPDPAAAGPTAGWTEPNWIVLEKQPRFALVLDRSGSMSSGHKMADAQHGAVYWLEFCAQGDDLLTVIWYDHAIDPILNLTEVSTLPNLNSVIADINALTPRGSTNIRDGLYAALDQIQTLTTRAAVQVALLLTDGKHNTPFGSQAAEVLPDFEEAGVRIYALGVGEPDQVEMDVLDQLAADTGGSSYSVGDNQPSEVETAMVEINAEVRGGIITTEPILFPDSRQSPLDIFTKAWIDKRERKRPPLQEIMKTLKIKSVKGLTRPDRRLRSRLVAVPVDIEPKCDRSSFTLVYPENQDLWLYLVDQKGQIIDMNGPNVHHVISDAPHEFSIVDHPSAGRWYMIALRPEAGPAFTFRSVAGAENRQLQVFGGATKLNPASVPVRIWASARWGNELTNLEVSAIVIDPNGKKNRVLLTDAQIDGFGDGIYEAYFTPKRLGRYRGIIRIKNLGDAVIAHSTHRILHTEERRLSLAAKAPRFVREIPFYFDSGDRAKIQDEERAKGTTERYAKLRPRPTKLKSAKVKPNPAKKNKK